MDLSGAVLPLIATPTDVNPCVRVSIIDDIVLDDLEEFGVLLTSGNPGISVRPARNSATVTILDDDNCKNSDKFHTHMHLRIVS